MGIPIAIGGRSTSSKLLPECSSTKGTHQRIITMGVNHDSSLSATAIFLIPKLESNKSEPSKDHVGSSYDEEKVNKNNSESELKDNSENVESSEIGKNRFVGEAPLKDDEIAETYFELVLEIRSLCQETSYSSHVIPHRFRIPLISLKSYSHTEATEVTEVTENDIVYENIETDVHPTVSFSSDDRYIACLIPPLFTNKNNQRIYRTSSTIVILALRKAKPKNNASTHHNLSLPSFIYEHPRESSAYLHPNTIPPIPIDPRIVRIQLNENNLTESNVANLKDEMNKNPLSIVTAICDATASSGSSILLAGCHNGFIFAISYRRAKLAGVLLNQTQMENKDENQHFVTPQKQQSRKSLSRGSSHIKFMTYCSPPHKSSALPSIGTSTQNNGRLATIRADGSIILYTSSFAATTGNINPEISNNVPISPQIVTRASSIVASPISFHKQASDISTSSFGTPDKASSQDIIFEKEADRIIHDNSTISSYINVKEKKSKKKILVMNIDLLATMKPKENITSNISHALWINFNTLAISAGNNTNNDDVTNTNNDIIAQVWHISNNGSVIHKRSELKMNDDILVQEMHGAFQPQNSKSKYIDEDIIHVERIIEQKNPEEESEGVLIDSFSLSMNQNTGIHFDSCTGCIVVSGVIQTSQHHSSYNKSFICVWDWTTNVLGLTLGSLQRNCVFSKAFFGNRGMSFIHYHMHKDNNDQYKNIHTRTACLTKMHKDVYKMGLLSPPSTSKMSSNSGRYGGWVDAASALFLTNNFVAIPFVSQSTFSKDSNLEWKEFLIPSTYADEYGPPLMATIGDKLGRSIAIASSRGVCLLDLYRMRNKIDDTAIKDTRSRVTPTDMKEKFLKYANNSPCIETSASNHTVYSSLNDKHSLRNASPKWKMFNNEDEESSFRVHAMVWWERNYEKSNSNNSYSVSEDILVAVIEYASNDSKDKFEGFLYLVCWSCQGLGMNDYQLLEEHVISSGSRSPEEYKTVSRKGIRLPNNLSPDAISILSEPQDENGDDRAVVLLSSTPAYFDDDLAYAAFQIQISSQLVDAKAQNVIVGKVASHGYISCISDSSDLDSCSCAGVFISGASFDFNHFQHQKENLTESVNEYVGTLGVIKTDGGGLDSVVIGSTGPAYSGSVLMNNCRSETKTMENLEQNLDLPGVAKYWLSDVIKINESLDHMEVDKTPPSSHNYFVWTIALNDGSIFTWNVPFFMHNETSHHSLLDLVMKDVLVEEKKVEQDLENEPTLLIDFQSSLDVSSVVTPRVMLSFDGSYSMYGNADNSQSVYLGFSSCILGDSSLWMNGVAATGVSEISLGPLPFSPHGCLLYSGQRCRYLQQRIPSVGISKEIYLVIELFGLIDCRVSAPAYTPSILSSLVDVSSLSISQKVPLEESKKTDEELVQFRIHRKKTILPDVNMFRRHINSLFEMEQSNDVITALKVLILRTCEYLSNVQSYNPPSTDDNLSSIYLTTKFAKTILSTINSIAIEFLEPLSFASLYLGISRQVEPHHFDVLFPLSLQSQSVEMFNNSIQNASKKSNPNQVINKITIEDLFDMSLANGSISVAMSALPIFSSQRRSHYECIKLLKFCIDKIAKTNIFNVTNIAINSDVEENIVLQLYQYGLKLEDAGAANVGHDDYDDIDSSSTTTSDSSDDSSSDEQESSIYESSADESFRDVSTYTEQLEQLSLGHSSFQNIIEDKKMNNETEENENNHKGNGDDSFVKINHEISDVRASKETEKKRGISGLRFLLFPSAKDKATTEVKKSVVSLETKVVSVESSQYNRKSVAVKKVTVSSTICEYFVSIAFFETVNFERTRWKSLVIVAQILMKDRIDISLYYSNQSSLMRILKDSLEDVDAAKQLFGVCGNSEIMSERSVRDNLKKEKIDIFLDSGKWFFVGRIMECMQQIDDESCDLIFKLSLLLLADHDNCLQIQKNKTALAVLIIITGHASGSLHNVLEESWKDTEVGKGYSLGAQEIVNFC